MSFKSRVPECQVPSAKQGRVPECQVPVGSRVPECQVPNRVECQSAKCHLVLECQVPKSGTLAPTADPARRAREGRSPFLRKSRRQSTGPQIRKDLCRPVGIGHGVEGGEADELVAQNGHGK